MKRLAIISSFLLLSILLCLYFSLSLNRYNNDLTDSIETLCTQIRAGIRDEEAFNAFTDEIDNFYRSVTIFINKTRLIDIKSTFARVRILFYEEDTPSLLAELEALKSYINFLHETEKPHVNTIL